MFYTIWTFYVLYRLFELAISRRNEGTHNYEEVGKWQRPLMMVLHISWFLFLVVEYEMKYHETSYVFVPNLENLFIVILLFFAAFLRYESMSRLGNLWSTKVFIIPEQFVVKEGAYKITNNPNYLGVVIEIFCLPYLFELNTVAIIFSILNILFLSLRIKLEREVLKIRSL
ncbi:isoprenylcysteine carboxylmethyltransferase family protein [Bacteriovorax sp. DB6_IX]|uniref:isoprenylcysteine carboxylmethyltransferase family protein n=1 Tax=Bacteriovorax sp. DB6_IX TaxID=1353530 RepID=UPI000389F35D|nr:isoprenylcysteine carboxylmethyltransferase family protein [Bacteriovorax sp. DB6_IX]EQC49712.1 isoprenylcysteine carboxyl methyltransferase family protein [Bacteriovorax sp. DB6_IX]